MATHTFVVKLWDGANGTGNPVAGVALTASTSDASVATIDGPHTTDSSGQATFTWTEVGNGSATLTIRDPNGHTVTDPITVSSGGISTAMAALLAFVGTSNVGWLYDAYDLTNTALTAGTLTLKDIRGIGNGPDLTLAATSTVIAGSGASRLVRFASGERAQSAVTPLASVDVDFFVAMIFQAAPVAGSGSTKWIVDQRAGASQIHQTFGYQTVDNGDTYGTNSSMNPAGESAHTVTALSGAPRLVIFGQEHGANKGDMLQFRTNGTVNHGGGATNTLPAPTSDSKIALNGLVDINAAPGFDFYCAMRINVPFSALGPTDFSVFDALATERGATLL